MYRAILYPNEGVNHGYETYLIQTSDGDTYIGVIGFETSTDLTLKLLGGTTQKIAKAAIKDRAKLDTSLMPGFGESLSKRDLVDLVQYPEALK
ncbi:hypothetical protein AWR27_09900 [Spirosoma montaniterrae]|uniref:Uncharacterized protein n=1 Tax=Spirosoma montaniterrae TaxID=1178516 RepID=A0A1P9WWA3_9BACT|nr:hypothetical protein AWR27_09900 [Spirosoma montaniterrae]